MSLSTANDSCCAVTAFIYQRFSAGKCLSTSTPHFIIHNPHVKDTVWLCWGKEGQLGEGSRMNDVDITNQST